MKNKRLLIRLLIGFLALALVFTYLSGQIYSYMLPEVTVQNQTPGTITKNVFAEGKFQYADKTAYNAPAACTIEKLYVQDGDTVAPGASLMKLRKDDLLTAKYQQGMQLDSLKAQRKGFAAGSDGDQLAKLQIDSATATLAEINRLLGQGCVVKSGDWMTITELPAQEKKKVEKDAELFSGADPTGRLQVAWTLSGSDAAPFRKGSPVTLTLRIFDESGQKTTRDVNSTIGKISPDAKSENYSCVCDVALNKGCSIALNEGDGVPVSLKYVSSEYSCVLPASAVTFDSAGDCTVYIVKERKKVFGTEEYVQSVTFTPIDYSDISVAYNGFIGPDRSSKVVTYTTKPLSDSQAVRLAADK